MIENLKSIGFFFFFFFFFFLFYFLFYYLLQKIIGCSHLFPVQTTIIPQILQKQLYGSDLCVCAPTGSGKTLAYVIPIVQDLMSRIVPRLRGLVIVPTRDLVSQVKSVFEQVAKNTNLRIESMYGNETFHKQQQLLFQNDSEQVDILISTPGRLIGKREKNLFSKLKINNNKTKKNRSFKFNSKFHITTPSIFGY